MYSEEEVAKMIEEVKQEEINNMAKKASSVPLFYFITISALFWLYE